MTFARSAAAAIASALLLVAAAPQARAMDEAERRAIEGVVREYILKNPEIILEAIETLQERQKAEEEAKGRKAIVSNADKLFRNPASPAAGAPDGDVTLVEFFDYNCGYCKAVMQDLQKLMEEDGKVRVVFKELPILSESSHTAAKAALAAHRQGKYLEAHNALMGHRGRLDDSAILRLVQSTGVDMERLKADMESPAIREAIAANQALAGTLGIRGTPAFVTTSDLVPGAIRLDEMKRLIESARKG